MQGLLLHPVDRDDHDRPVTQSSLIPIRMFALIYYLKTTTLLFRFYSINNDDQVGSV